jgi:hypothetical protein
MATAMAIVAEFRSRDIGLGRHPPSNRIHHRAALLWRALVGQFGLMLPDNSGRLDQFLSLDGAPRSCH